MYLLLALSLILHAATEHRCADDLAADARAEAQAHARDPMIEFDVWDALARVDELPFGSAESLARIEDVTVRYLRKFNQNGRPIPTKLALFAGTLMFEHTVAYLHAHDVAFMILENPETGCRSIEIEPAENSPHGRFARRLASHYRDLRVRLEPCVRYPGGAAGGYSGQNHTLSVGDRFPVNPSVRDDVALHELRHARTIVDVMDLRYTPYAGHFIVEGGRLPGPAEPAHYSEFVSTDEMVATLASARHLVLDLKKAVRLADAREIEDLIRRLEFTSRIGRVVSLRVLESVKVIRAHENSAVVSSFQDSRRADFRVGLADGHVLEGCVFFHSSFFQTDAAALRRQLDGLERAAREHARRFEELGRRLAHSRDPVWLADGLMSAISKVPWAPPAFAVPPMTYGWSGVIRYDP